MKRISIVIIMLFLSQVLQAQVDPPDWDCCVLLWSAGCELGWATALNTNTQIRMRWDPADQGLVDHLNRAAEAIIGAHRACSKMNMAWDDAQAKAEWLYRQRDMFLANPDRDTRRSLLFNLEGTYYWADQLKRQVYYDEWGQYHETNFPTCAEKYFKVGYLLSKAVQHYRQADEAFSYGRSDWQKEIAQANSLLQGLSTVLDEYWLVQTGTCVDLTAIQPHQRIYAVYTTPVSQQNIKSLIAALDSVWQDISNALYNNCLAAWGGSPVSGGQPGINVQQANASHFVGTYDYTDPDRTYAQFHGVLFLYADGRLENDEWLDGQYSRNRGKWTYDQGTTTLSLNWESGAYFSGPVTGNTNDFTISGRWSNGNAGRMRCVRK